MLLSCFQTLWLYSERYDYHSYLESLSWQYFLLRNNEVEFFFTFFHEISVLRLFPNKDNFWNDYGSIFHLFFFYNFISLQSDIDWLFVLFLSFNCLGNYNNRCTKTNQREQVWSKADSKKLSWFFTDNNMFSLKTRNTVLCYSRTLPKNLVQQNT